MNKFISLEMKPGARIIINGVVLEMSWKGSLVPVSVVADIPPRPKQTEKLEKVVRA